MNRIANLPGIPVMLAEIEADLRAALRQLDDQPSAQMAEMIAYHLGWQEGEGSGKRLRPLYVTLCCQAAGGDWRLALPAASSIELIHNFSLIHDDIEDDSDMRRGRPTVWKKWGIPQAINLGDALFVLARLAAHRLAGIPDGRARQVLEILDRATLDLTRGQHLDLAFETRQSVAHPDYLTMIEGKTASLFAAACLSGALIAGAPARLADQYQAFGLHLGMAFQILDDILGIWGDSLQTGKPTGDDLLARKKTLPVVIGMQTSPEFVRLWNRRRSSQTSIKRMVALLESCGALEQTHQAAGDHTRLALEALQASHASGPAAEAIQSLSLDLLHRDF